MAANNSWKDFQLEDSDDEPVDQLEQFRQQWKAEVAKGKKDCKEHKDSAVDLYYRGVESERDGRLDVAIQFYRQAIHIDPDVEVLVAKMDQVNMAQNSSNLEYQPSATPEELFNSTLLERFSHILTKDGSADDINFLNLPAEVLCLIIRWVASSDVDMRSIEALSETCTKLYVHSRDTTLWRAACEKVWGATLEYKPYFSWRNMFIQRPRVQWDGVYVSLVSYFSPIESSSFCSTFKPYRCIEYYRYMRFFSNGQMILHTTHEAPIAVISTLTFENAEILKFRVGPYKLCHECCDGNTSLRISADLQDCVESIGTSHKAISKKINRCVVKGVDYHIDLELTTTKSKQNSNNKLSWLRYSLYYKFHNPRNNYSYNIPLQEQYPPLYFSRVKSYSSVSEGPL